MKAKVIEFLNECTDEELIGYHNQMACETGEETIEENTEDWLDSVFQSANEAIRATTYGDYNYAWKWARFNAYGNLDSFDYITDEIDKDELAEYIIDHIKDFDMDIED
jgi:hypothetical protein